MFRYLEMLNLLVNYIVRSLNYINSYMMHMWGCTCVCKCDY